MNNANMQGDGTEHRLERFSRIQKDALVLLLLCKEKGTAIVPFTRLLGFINSVPDSQDVAEPNLRKSLKTLQQNGYVWKYRGQSRELQATSFRVRRLEAWGQADE
ncbi:hypothetical protein [Citrobacter freundii complex sp. 2024EL-00748]|uniref:hypothetical protein n=1 Tax=Citrobacter freundii complex sp. 2024EL-00748 TaxID=3382813 RepID=UPI003BE14079